MSKLYLIGTVHLDFTEGPRKLKSLYDRLKPDVILCEADRKYIDRIDSLVARIEEEFKDYRDEKGFNDYLDLLRTMSLGFELSTNLAYAREKGIECHLADTTEGCSSLIDIAENYFYNTLKSSKQNGEKIDFEKSARHVKSHVPLSQKGVREILLHFKRWENTLLNEVFLFVCKRLKIIGERDKYMERIAREFYSSGKVIAFPVGAFHTLNSFSGETLYSRIKDLNPERILLM